MNKPYFLWDYDLTDKQIHGILRGVNEVEKLWLIGRIMTHAKFEDIWKYLSPEDITKVFSKLRLTPKDREYWQRAFSIWGYHV